MKSKKLNPWKAPNPGNLTDAKVINVFGKERSNVSMGWRLKGAGSDEYLKAQLVGGILYNQKAGLIDMNLVQQQSIGPNSSAGAWTGLLGRATRRYCR